MRMNRYLFAIMVAVVLASSAYAQFPRTVLIEEFTSVTCKPCTTATAVLNQLIRDKGDNVVTVRNEVNFAPSPNPYSSVESESRKADFYQTETLPHGRVDGQIVAVTNQSELYARVEDRLMVEAPIKIELTQTREGSLMNVQVKLTAGSNGLQGNYVLHVVALEHEIYDPSILNIPGNNHETTIFDVMRKMVNGLSGEPITLDVDETKTIPAPYTIESAWNGDQLYTVAFVQNVDTKEVIQATFSPRPGSLGSVDRDPLPAGFAIGSALPTPSSTKAILPISIGRAGDVTIAIYDLDGARVGRQDLGTLEAGDYTPALDLSGLANGVYSCVVTTGDIRMTRKIVIAR